MTGAHLEAMQEAFPPRLVVVTMEHEVVTICGLHDVTTTYTATVDIANPEQPRIVDVHIFSMICGSWQEWRADEIPEAEVRAELEQDLMICDDNTRAHRIYRRALACSTPENN